MSEQPTIVEFMTARLDEDEALASSAIPPRVPDQDYGDTSRWSYDGNPSGAVSAGRATLASASSAWTGLTDGGRFARHIAHHDPARVLREVEVKRRIVALAEPYMYVPDDDWGESIQDTFMSDALKPCLRALASVYSDHPDYREEWA